MENLKNYIDRHKGRTAFVLGIGPSLRNLSPDLLKPHITIAVNSSICKVPKADYYFTCDTGMVLWESWFTLKHLTCEIILATNCGINTFESRIERKVLEGINMRRVHYLPRKANNIIDKGDKLIKGSSSVHAAVHFAHVLGCSPIVLIGCDCQYTEGKKRYYDFPNQPKDKLIDSKFEKFRRPYGPDSPGNSTDGELQHHLEVWKNMNIKDLNIIDASEGALTMFPQKTIKEIIK